MITCLQTIEFLRGVGIVQDGYSYCYQIIDIHNLKWMPRRGRNIVASPGPNLCTLVAAPTKSLEYISSRQIEQCPELNTTPPVGQVV